ncbi:Lrp/AsnC family transcriptional regulator [Microbacterium aquimaris]
MQVSESGTPGAAQDEADGVDRMIAAALQVNGRASWGEVARVLDLPERTVARRGQRLLDRGWIRISTYVDVARVLHARATVLRVTTEPAALWDVARALSRRTDASSVSVLEGSNDVGGMLLPRDDAAVRRLLYREIPAIPGIVSVNVARVLRFFRSGSDWIAPGLLTPEQVGTLRGDPAPSADPADAISAEEERMIDLLLLEGRMPIAQLARALEVNATTARRRLDSLHRRGLMHPRTEVVPSLFGLGLEALVWMRAPMARMEKIGKALAAAPEVKFVVATTGSTPLLANVLVRDEDDFYRFLTSPVIAENEGLEVVESLVVVTPVLRGSLLIDEGPDREGQNLEK